MLNVLSTIPLNVCSFVTSDIARNKVVCTMQIKTISDRFCQRFFSHTVYRQFFSSSGYFATCICHDKSVAFMIFSGIFGG